MALATGGARPLLILTLSSSLLLACGGAAAPAGAEAPRGDAPAQPSGKADDDGIVHFALGDFHTCAVRGPKRDVWCWGRNRAGELGDGGASGDRVEPIRVEGLEGAEEVAAGADFSCARMRDRTVRCWGSGRIFDEAQSATRLVPTQLRGGTDAVELRAGGYTLCARLASGGARCWGNEDAIKHAPSTGVAQIAVAATHACARMKDGTARCWGEGPWSGARGLSFAEPKLKGVLEVSTGDSFACAVVSGGAEPVQCWGRNDQGELGVNPDEDNHTKPVAVRNLPGTPRRLSSAESHTCASMNDGTLVCWGANTEGELGRPERSTQELPAPAQGIAGVLDFAIGADHACATTGDGVLRCWGGNRSGQLGDGSKERRLAPVAVAWGDTRR